MAHFTYTKPSGNWTDGVDTITEASLESFEQKMFKSINGDEGGTWSPSSEIEILGSGLKAGKLRLTTAESFVADIAALKALTGMANGQSVFVKRIGWFFYEDPDSTTEALPFVAQPTVGTGRWFFSGHSLKNQVILHDFLQYASAPGTVVTAGTTSNVLSETVATLPGDKVDVTYHYSLDMADLVAVYPRINGVSQATNIGYMDVSSGSVVVNGVAMGFDAASGGVSTSLNLRVDNSAGGTQVTIKPISRRVLVVRG